MAPIGHVKLGPYNDIRPYVVDDVRNIGRDGANPFAAPGGGSQGYNDLEGWAEFTMKDWQAGAGSTDPEDGGFLFGTMDSRVPNQLTLPNMVWPTLCGGLDQTWNKSWMVNRIGTFRNVGPTLAVRWTGVLLGNPTIGSGFVNPGIDGSKVYAYLWGPVGTVVTMYIYRCEASVIGALLAQVNITLDNKTMAPRWECFTFPTAAGNLWSAASPNNYYAIAIGANADIIVGQTPGRYGVREITHNGSVWTIQGEGMTAPPSIVPGDQIVTQDVTHDLDLLAEYYGTVYGASSGRTQLYRWNDTAYQWDYVGANASAIYALYGGTALLTMGCKSTKNYSYDAASGLFAEYATSIFPTGTHIFAYDDKYLWASNGISIYYTSGAAGAVTTGILNIASATYPILAMACMNGSLYFSTARGLGRIALGDFPEGVVKWHSYVDNTDVKMAEFQGSLFIVTNNMLYRIDQSHTLMQVRIPGNDDQLNSYGRTITALCAGNSWLYIATFGTSGGMLWAWTPQGMHPVATLPTQMRRIVYARTFKSLFLGGSGRAWRMYMPDAAIDPYFDTASVFDSDGWMETDKFFGSNVLLRKDFESVYIDREGRDALGDVTVYWQDDTHTTWQTLGTLNGVSGELRWSNYGTRPSSRWIRLGVKLRVATGGYYGANRSPRIRAISLKYIPMVNDRFRWRVNILVPPRMMDVDDELYTATYTQAQMLAHIDACIKSVAPVIFEDVDGVQYEVKVTAHSRSVERWESVRGGTEKITYVYSLTIEQVTSGAFSG